MSLHVCQNPTCFAHVNTMNDKIGVNSFRCSSCAHVQTIDQDPEVDHSERSAMNTRTIFVQCLNEGGKVHEFRVPVDPTHPHDGVDMMTQVRCTCSMPLPVETVQKRVVEKIVDDQGREVLTTKVIDVERVPMVAGMHTYLDLFQFGQELTPAGVPIERVRA